MYRSSRLQLVGPENNHTLFIFVEARIVFVHVSAIQRCGSLREGDKVSYEIGQDQRTGKSKAENVSVI